MWQLRNTKAIQTSWIDLDILSPNRHEALYLSADLKATIVDEHESSRHASANLMLLAADNQQNWDYQLPHLLAAVASTRDWSHFEKGFKLEPDAVQYRISANLSGVNASLLIKNITLYSAEKNVLYRAGYFILLSGWVLFLLYLIWHMTKHSQYLYPYWPLGAVMLFILTGILLPADIKNDLLIQVHALFQMLSVDFPVPGAADSLNNAARPLLPLDKTGHLFAFTAAGVVLAWKSKARYIELLPLLVLFAVASETLQFFIPGRNPLLMDVAIDITGILAGTGLAYLVKQICLTNSSMN